MKTLALLAALLVLPVTSHAQKAMGSVATADANVSGGLEVAGARARLVTNANVTALERTAQVDLDRGGLIKVCATSALHLLRSGTGDALLLALDRGAMELHTMAQGQDVILTPDLRLTMTSAGPLDLRMRVTREGDTCVDNRGTVAPVLQVTEAFGDAQYRLAPGQHVLFEHGHLREVVDTERSDCGCPPPTPVVVVASAANGTSVVSPTQAAAQNPFPVAQSAGLSNATPAVPLPAVTRPTLAYNASGDAAPAVPAVAAAPVAAPAVVATGPPPAPPGARDLAHRVGRFFKRLFGGKS